MFTPIINISKPYWLSNPGNSCCLGHETGIHWITIRMTMEAYTIGCEHDIKQMHAAALRDPWVETL